MNIKLLSHKEKIQYLDQNLKNLFNHKEFLPMAQKQEVIQTTINNILADLLEEEIVEMKKVGFLRWVQTNPTMAVIIILLVSFGSGVSLADIITPLIQIFI